MTNDNATYTLIDNTFIDKYLTTAPPLYVVIYIYLHKQTTDGKYILINELARTFNLVRSDIINILDFWQQLNVLQYTINSEILTITLNNEQPSQAPTEQLTITQTQEALQPTQTPRPVILSTRPTYEPRELELYMATSAEIKSLFDNAKKSIGRTLNSNDLNTIFSFYDWLGLPFDLIIFLIDYCVSKGKSHFNYIEKVAIDWAERGIYTIDDALLYIERDNNFYGNVQKALGMNNRQPTPSQKKLLEKWEKEFHMPLDVILEACDKAVLQTQNPNYKYVDGILKNWNDMNIRTVEDVYKHEEEHLKSLKQTPRPAQKSQSTYKPKTKKVDNYTPEKRDYAEIARLEQLYIQKQLEKGE